MITADSVTKIPGDMEVLHLTSSSAPDTKASLGSRMPSPTPLASVDGEASVNVSRAAAEVAVFFPNIAAEQLAKGTLEDPQTQMQIEQQKENKG